MCILVRSNIQKQKNQFQISISGLQNSKEFFLSRESFALTDADCTMEVGIKEN